MDIVFFFIFIFFDIFFIFVFFCIFVLIFFFIGEEFVGIFLGFCWVVLFRFFKILCNNVFDFMIGLFWLSKIVFCCFLLLGVLVGFFMIIFFIVGVGFLGEVWIVICFVVVMIEESGFCCFCVVFWMDCGYGVGGVFFMLIFFFMVFGLGCELCIVMLWFFLFLVFLILFEVGGWVIWWREEFWVWIDVGECGGSEVDFLVLVLLGILYIDWGGWGEWEGLGFIDGEDCVMLLWLRCICLVDVLGVGWLVVGGGGSGEVFGSFFLIVFFGFGFVVMGIIKLKFRLFFILWWL